MIFVYNNIDKTTKRATMQTAKISEITELLQQGLIYADFTERSGHKINREHYGIYDVRTSALGSFMVKFNEACNAGKIVHYIDLRIPNIEFSKLFMDYNMPMKNDAENPDYTLLYKMVQSIRTKPSGMTYDAALTKFNGIMQRPDISMNASQKYVHARVMYDVINQMISMGPRNTKYSVIPYGFRVTVTFQGGAVERVNFEHRVSSNSNHETIKIEIPSIKLTERFNNYEDRTNILLFDQAKRYMDALKPREQLAQGTERFDRLDEDYCNLMSRLMAARHPSITK